MTQQALLEQWRAWLTPSESAFEFFARVRTEPLLTGVPLLDKHVPSPLRPGCLLEIVGPSGVGKTELLLEVRVLIGGSKTEDREEFRRPVPWLTTLSSARSGGHALHSGQGARRS